MMRNLPLKFLHIYVGLSVIAYMGMLLSNYNSIEVPSLLVNHLNDFLIIPIVGLCSLHVLWLIKKTRDLRLGWISIASLVLLYSWYFELYLPDFNPRYTADINDVVSYSLGGIILYILQKLP